MLPTREEALKLICDGLLFNPGPWGKHCLTAAHCAEKIASASQELINQIQRLDNNLEETTNYIRHVLAVYKAKDEMLKAIMASQNMV